eukprot:CAMPEP_0114536766 /NCGR_PEP_ID=MMETSP0109-20121206/29194_1 /TAXON_ID=29199 /ORGANISM="Chlorarachnion reptans, Strain CCCM449" /LENGTH=405 /DNA_ID=CAMNT_0001720559 /DNA_START=221 /DNA_END=1435 /DNA_ORIENTATION=-
MEPALGNVDDIAFALDEVHVSNVGAVVKVSQNIFKRFVLKRVDGLPLARRDHYPALLTLEERDEHACLVRLLVERRPGPWRPPEEPVAIPDLLHDLMTEGRLHLLHQGHVVGPLRDRVLGEGLRQRLSDEPHRRRHRDVERRPAVPPLAAAVLKVVPELSVLHEDLLAARVGADAETPPVPAVEFLEVDLGWRLWGWRRRRGRCQASSHAFTSHAAMNSAFSRRIFVFIVSIASSPSGPPAAATAFAFLALALARALRFRSDAALAALPEADAQHRLDLLLEPVHEAPDPLVELARADAARAVGHLHLRLGLRVLLEVEPREGAQGHERVVGAHLQILHLSRHGELDKAVDRLFDRAAVRDRDAVGRDPEGRRRRRRRPAEPAEEAVRQRLVLGADEEDARPVLA